MAQTVGDGAGPFQRNYMNVRKSGGSVKRARTGEHYGYRTRSSKPFMDNKGNVFATMDTGLYRLHGPAAKAPKPAKKAKRR